MTLVATLLCLCSVLPSPQGELQLPPHKQRSDAPAAPQRPASELERFRRDLMEMKGSDPKVEAKLQEMSVAYPAIEPLILEVARSARANEMENLMVVARRFGNASGTTRVADELLFQLLARPLGEATRATVETMVLLKGAEAKKALQECVRGRVAAARRHATVVLARMAAPDDLDFAMQMASEQTLDLQLRGVELLCAVPDERARARVVEMLSKDPAIAGAACLGLVQLGEAAVPHLKRLCAEPAIDRGFVYAAFALAQIDKATGGKHLPDDLAKPLAATLESRDVLTRSLAAIPLADLAFRAATAAGPFPDARLCEVLIDVVAPQQFVPNLDILRRPAEDRLLRLTGRVVAAGEALPWREWWKLQKDTFVGVRASIDVDVASAAYAVVVARHDQRHVRLVAEGLADLPPVEGALEVLLTAAQMTELIAAMQAAGFGDPEAMRVASGLPPVRSVQIQVRDGRAQVAVPAGEHPAFEAMVGLIDRQVQSELWQLYRHPADEPDRAAFWRAERRWREANPDPVEHGRRFGRRLVQQWASLSPGLRARGLEHLLAHPQRRQLLGEEDGERAVAVLRSLPELGELDLRLLELAAAVPGDRVWRQCVDLAATARGGGRQAVRAVFAVLGPDAVLSALQDQSAIVRRAAIDEVVIVRDQRAAGRLVELVADADADVRLAAAHACGHLQVAAAAAPLIAAIADEATVPALRRECLRSLGRVGGDKAFAVLQRALTAPGKDDKEAALRGLGELRDPRASHLLAELAVIGHGNDLGELARYYLQRQGGILAVPALRAQLQVVQDPDIRDQLVLLLGLYQEPTVVPDLMDLLRNQKHALEAAGLLASSTGVDLVAATDRIALIEQWWRKNRQAPQWQWLLDGLRAADEATSLRADQFAPGAGIAPVVELARLLVEARQPRLRVLCAAVLRTVTNEDFGVVTVQTPTDVCQGIAARYRLLAESVRAAQGR